LPNVRALFNSAFAFSIAATVLACLETRPAARSAEVRASRVGQYAKRRMQLRTNAFSSPSL
jgi:hypothetical protein